MVQYRGHGSIRRQNAIICRPALQMPKCNENLLRSRLLGVVHYPLRERPARHELWNASCRTRPRRGLFWCETKKSRFTLRILGFRQRPKITISAAVSQTLVQNAFFLRNHLAGFGAEYEEQTPAGSHGSFSDPHLRSDRGFENRKVTIRPFTLPQSSTR